jgi:hypothetical protein
MSYLYVPFLIQGLLMMIDEYIHHQRGLGLWEKLGHPLDTLTVFVPLSFMAFHEFSRSRLTTFILLSVFSCFFITKDEFIHKRECSTFESWIHSLLFILHPIIFFSSGILWRYHSAHEFLAYQSMAVGLFMIYQLLKWSIPWKKQIR